MNVEKKEHRSSYYSEAQATARLDVLGQRADLFRYQIDGYSAWRLLRFKLALLLQSLPFSNQSKPSRIIWAKDRLSYFFRDIPVFLFPGHKDIVVKTFSTALSEEENGRYKDIYFDDLFEDRSACFKIESINNPDYAKRRKKAFIPIAMTTGFVDLASALFVFLKIPTHTRRLAEDIYRNIQKEFEGYPLAAKSIQVSLVMFYWSKRLYKWLLSRIKPKIVLSADTGEFALWAAAHELGIPTIEFQHGVFTRLHPDAMNSSMSIYRDHLIVANKLLLFGDFWKKQLLLNQYYQDELVVVGNPRIDRYREMRKTFLMDRSRDKNISILVASQGVDVERMVEILRGFMELADARLKYSLQIKLHPAERQKTIYLHGLKYHPQVKILYGFESPSTYELLVKAHLHISIGSTVHYDALGLFVPTAVLPLAGHEVVQHLVDDGHAHLVRTPAELLDLALNIRAIKVTRDVSYYYYEPNALQNIRREIGRFL